MGKAVCKINTKITQGRNLFYVSNIYTAYSSYFFSVLVVVHEAGHFAVAKLNGIYVEEFSVGMGPLVYSKTIGDTMYSIRALPLGGFCRMMVKDRGQQ